MSMISQACGSTCVWCVSRCVGALFYDITLIGYKLQGYIREMIKLTVALLLHTFFNLFGVCKIVFRMYNQLILTISVYVKVHLALS